ncbi:DUF4231 domain-containing protein [Embleya sp. NPDC059237]|uniref:DUF4231 domain-containing protein n=1 Tax=Embleya sp. NPDC059237 TaxID=3346784 RepID=UPI003675132D
MTSPTSAGPIELLLSYSREIVELQHKVHMKRLQLRFMYGSGALSLAVGISSFGATAVTWRKVDLGPINAAMIPLALILGAVSFGFYIYMSDHPLPKLKALLLNLDIAEERKRLSASQLHLDTSIRQFSYKDSIPGDLESLRKEATHYRRIHNFFQSIIILGSLGTTTAAALTDAPSPYKEITIGLSFLVGMSAGFTGYFKYKERGFYLQQTADAIEQHTTAFDLGIPPYANQDPAANLGALVREVENLRVEQRKRQQQLDQPHEGARPAAN